MKKSYILTEGSRSIGFGHIVRCIALYDELKKKKLNPHFIVSGDKNINFHLKGKNSTILNWQHNSKELRKLIENSDCIVVDSYKAAKKDYSSISKLTKLLVCIDDNNRVNYPSGIITNSALNAIKLPYPKSQNKTYLLGEKYLLLRDSFKKVASKKTTNELKAVLITLGGSDIRNLSNQVLSLLVKHYPNLKKIVIIGSGFRKKNVEKIKQWKDKNVKLIYSPDAPTMKKYMQDVPIGISASGQTINELSRIGLPTISIVVADNQKNNALGWSKKGFTVNAGDWDDPDLFINILNGMKKLATKKERDKRTKIGQSLVDGLGAERIVNLIIKKLK
jgi:UDP-2,4-diacetamido-2,4,6-trideoxy-beta-L-altropyranose hydrolase